MKSWEKNHSSAASSYFDRATVRMHVKRRLCWMVEGNTLRAQRILRRALLRSTLPLCTYLSRMEAAELIFWTKENGFRIFLIQACSTAGFWVDCLYGFCDERNAVVRPECTITLEELSTSKKPSVRHL